MAKRTYDMNLGSRLRGGWVAWTNPDVHRDGIGLSHVQWMLLAAFARAGATETKHGQASPHTPLFIRVPYNATLVHATPLKTA